MSLFYPTRNIIVPRRMRLRGEDGFISPALIGAIAGSRRRTAGGLTKAETFGADEYDNAVTPGSQETYKYVATYCASTGSGYTIKQIIVRMFRVGTGTAPSMVGKLYDNSGTAPNTELATSTNTVNSADVGTSAQNVIFSFAGCAVGKYFHFDVTCPSYDASSYYKIRTTNATNQGHINVASAGVSWTQQSSRAQYVEVWI